VVDRTDQPPAPPSAEPWLTHVYGSPPSTPPVPATNGLAIAAFVCAVSWVGGLGSVAAIILGFVARKQIRRTRDRGFRLATSGVFIGVLGLVGTVALNALVVVPFAHSRYERAAVSNGRVEQDMLDAANAEDAYDNAHPNSFATDPAALAPFGFDPGSNEVILVGVAPAGYCIVGVEDSTDSVWFLLDDRGLSFQQTYNDQASAEHACSDPTITSYATLVGVPTS
jgi:hypothetical protein